jgi:1,2-diacylglycerol 3-alpha-glucosyltransferase
MVQEQNISGIHFVGWKSHEELPSSYALASCFILPSISETWGLVVNEAMACGLPVLVSRNCGCVPELCHDGQNGYSFDPNLTEGMTKLLLNISSNDRQLPALGKMSREIISTFTPQIWAGAIRDCILASMEVQARG